MPKTTMNKDHGFRIEKQNIRVAGKIRMHFVFYLSALKKIMNFFFKSSPFTSNIKHTPASLAL